ncbi:hypothetical protein [Thalassospira alkalitolerans]|uniref:hypothetical protein n=1 Tax=Thalassospira alkalitolerans TaxID=1293890 RepID=UPI003AA8F8C5
MALPEKAIERKTVPWLALDHEGILLDTMFDLPPWKVSRKSSSIVMLLRKGKPLLIHAERHGALKQCLIVVAARQHCGAGITLSIKCSRYRGPAGPQQRFGSD